MCCTEQKAYGGQALEVIPFEFEDLDNSIGSDWREPKIACCSQFDRRMLNLPGRFTETLTGRFTDDWSLAVIAARDLKNLKESLIKTDA